MSLGYVGPDADMASDSARPEERQSRGEPEGAGTEDAEAYEEMTRLNNELAQAQREMAKKNVELERLNEQKNQFLGMAAHDMRNPLAVIQGYSEILLDGIGDDLPEAEREMLEVVHSSSEFMLRMVNDLLDVSRIESGRLELDRAPTDLGALLDHNVQLNRLLAARKDIQVELEVEDGLPLLSLDAGKVEQVLNNLLSNAVKYSHEGTCIRVRCRRRGDGVQVRVEDEGQGIPEDELDHLFQAFTTTSVSATAGEESTGLGLMIARRIAEGHAGAIQVESTVGEGSTFTVLLPLGEVGEEAPRRDPPTEGAETGGGEPVPGPARDILLADDNRTVRGLVAAILEAKGHRVTVVGSGEAALEAAETESYDLLLLDLEMPGGGGLETARALRASGHDVPILALTGHDEERVGVEVREAGMAGLVGKPVDAAELLATLQAALGE